MDDEAIEERGGEEEEESIRGRWPWSRGQDPREGKARTFHLGPFHCPSRLPSPTGWLRGRQETIHVRLGSCSELRGSHWPSQPIPRNPANVSLTDRRIIVRPTGMQPGLGLSWLNWLVTHPVSFFGSASSCLDSSSV